MWKVIFMVFVLFLLGCAARESSDGLNLDQKKAIANCLADKGVKEYGAFWCANCAKQKKLFGSADDIIMERGVYVECDPRGDNEQSALCLEKEVAAYPDWELPDGTRLKGVQELKVLADAVGCNY
jgi:hypothetical protein